MHKPMDRTYATKLTAERSRPRSTEIMGCGSFDPNRNMRHAACGQRSAVSEQRTPISPRRRVHEATVQVRSTMGYQGASAGELPSYSFATQVPLTSGARGFADQPHQHRADYTQLPPSTKARHRSPQDGAAVTDNHMYHPPALIPAAMAMDGRKSCVSVRTAAPRAPEARVAGVDPGDVLLVDLGSRSLLGEDLEKALRLWTRPAVLIAGRNMLDGLPANIPGTILYLDLSWNRLTLLEGFGALPNLRELDVSHNSVQNMLGLSSTTELRVLRISHNCIRRIEGLHRLKWLEEADFSHNLLRTKAAMRALSLNAGLRRLRIEGNPFCTTGVQHGTYQIAMQHLLPGMTLLDGKPSSSLATSLSSTLPLPPPRRPPPPRTATTRQYSHCRGGAHRSRRASSCSPDRRAGATREGLFASSSLDFVGDLSVERRWRDSAAAGSGQGLSMSPAGGCDDTRESCIRVTTGGGGPTVAPGSYAEMFVAALRKERPTSTAVGAATATTATAAAAAAAAAAAGTPNNLAATAALSTKQREATLNRRYQTGQDNAAPPAPPTEAVGHRHKRESTAPVATCERGIDVGGRHTGVGDTTVPPSLPTSSLLSYRGLSRAERGAARRRAWSHARQEGVVGDGRRVQQQRRSSFRNLNQNAHGCGGGGGGGGVENPSRINRSSTAKSHTRGRSSPTMVSGHRSRRSIAGDTVLEVECSDSGGGGKANRQSGRAGSALARSSNSGSRGGGTWRDGGDSLAKPGATRRPARASNSRGRQTSSDGFATVARARNGPCQAVAKGVSPTATRGVRSGIRSGRGRGVANLPHDRSTSVPTGDRVSGSGNSGSTSKGYRFQTTLGQRNQQRPLAPMASPWTPRQDAEPWGCNGGGRRRVRVYERSHSDKVNNESDDAVIANSIATSANPSSYPGYGRVDGGSGSGLGFVSPLSPAGILHRVSSGPTPTSTGSLQPPSVAGLSPIAAATLTPGEEGHSRWMAETDMGMRRGSGGSTAATSEGGHGIRDQFHQEQQYHQRKKNATLLPAEEEPAAPSLYDAPPPYSERSWSERSCRDSAIINGKSSNSIGGESSKRGSAMGMRLRGYQQHSWQQEQEQWHEHGHEHEHEHEQEQEQELEQEWEQYWRRDHTDKQNDVPQYARKSGVRTTTNTRHWNSSLFRREEDATESTASGAGRKEAGRYKVIEESERMLPWSGRRGITVDGYQYAYDDEEASEVEERRLREHRDRHLDRQNLHRQKNYAINLREYAAVEHEHNQQQRQPQQRRRRRQRQQPRHWQDSSGAAFEEQETDIEGRRITDNDRRTLMDTRKTAIVDQGPPENFPKRGISTGCYEVDDSDGSLYDDRGNGLRTESGVGFLDGAGRLKREEEGRTMSEGGVEKEEENKFVDRPSSSERAPAHAAEKAERRAEGGTGVAREGHQFFKQPLVASESAEEVEAFEDKVKEMLSLIVGGGGGGGTAPHHQ